MTTTDLYIDLDNRDLVYHPEFASTPTLNDQYFRFTNHAWIANALVITQAVAQAMESPNISRTEVDPFGSAMTTKNISFILKLGSEIADDSVENTKSAHFLEEIDFERYTPAITVTRILKDYGYNVRYYGNRQGEIAKEIGIDYDLIAEKEDQLFLVRTIRPSDRHKESIKRVKSEIQDLEHQALFLYESEIKPSLQEEFSDDSDVVMKYIDLSNEKLGPVTSGFPLSFEDFTGPEEVRERIEEVYEAADGAESTKEKGNRLEELMRLIFEKAVPDTTVEDVNNRTRVEEIDLQLRNDEQRFPWKNLGSPINVECKNWSKPAGVKVVYTAFGKAQATSPNCKGIILVCWEGVSDSKEGRNADQLIREIRQKGVNILVLDKDDLRKIANTGDAQSVFEKKAGELWNR